MQVRHAEQSAILSADDDYGRPNKRLIELALAATASAMNQTFTFAEGRTAPALKYLQVWPGEHYQFLAGLVEVMQPKLIVEIGTDTGMSALALRERLPAGGKVVTFDVLPWQQCKPVVREEDFADGRIEQVLADLTKPDVFAQHKHLLEAAPLIFIDAAKDKVCEPRILANLETCKFPTPPIIVFDDIRVMNMIAIWRQIARPKLDITSFGHWSGTGMIEWM